jgi:hypothetical protein
MIESLRNIEFTRSRTIVAVVVLLAISCLLCSVGWIVFNVAFGPAPEVEQAELVGEEELPVEELFPTFTLAPTEIEIPTWTPTSTPTPIPPTSTPIPIYTPTPTDTPPPTDTPVPPPPTNTPAQPAAPAAAPAPPALSEEELAYANAFISQAKQWEESHDRSMKLLSITKPYDYEWKTHFDAEMDTWQRLISEAQALQAPSRFQDFNDRYQENIELYIKAKDSIVQGVGDIYKRYELSEFNLGMDYMLTAQRAIHELYEEMKVARGTP